MSHKLIKGAALATLGAAGAAVAGCGITYASRIRTMRTLWQHTNYADGFNLYTMRVLYDYDLNSVLNSHITDNDTFMQAIVNASAPHVPFKIEAPNFACSAFTLAVGQGSEQVFMGRNYDFIFDTSALVVECNPKNGYKSLGIAALNNVHADAPFKTYKKRLACLGAPFICLDGVNEKGVSIAVLTLDSSPADQKTNKQKITTSLAIRLVLDRAATTQDAVELLRSYDMFATSGRDYHFYITDASGNGCVVEWDPLSPTREITVTPMRTITNFYAMYKDKVKPNQKNGVYGHGLERYNAIEGVLDAANFGEDNAENTENSSYAGNAGDAGKCAQSVAWDALHASAQDPNSDDPTSNTQYSAVYDNTNKSVSISIRRHWKDTFEFSL